MSKNAGLLDRPMSVPCGKCSGCRADKSREWSVRLYHELQSHKRATFVTLTYNDGNYPDDGKINKKHLQDFFKRLRFHSQVPIRYFASGEYGEKTRRAHYHAIIFGDDFRDGSVPVDHQLYTNEFLQRTWRNGFVSCGDVTLQSIMYVAGYTQKKNADPDTFIMMSKRPPIGENWLNNYYDEVVKNECITIQGQKFKIPRAYLKRREADFTDYKRKTKKEAQKYSLELDFHSNQANKQINFESRLKEKKEII